MGAGLAIAGLVIAIIGLCVPLLGLVGIVLGIIVIARATATANGRDGGRGIAVAAITVGVIGLLMSFLMVGLLLPALGKARQTAREIQSAAQMSVIARSIIDDERDRTDGGQMDYDLEARLQLEPGTWAMDADAPKGAGTAYILFAPEDPRLLRNDDPDLVILVENPKVFDRKRLNVTFGDGSTRGLPRAEVEALLQQAAGRVYNSDGTPWKR